MIALIDCYFLMLNQVFLLDFVYHQYFLFHRFLVLHVIHFHNELIEEKKINLVQLYVVVQVNNHMLYKVYHDDIYK